MYSPLHTSTQCRIRPSRSLLFSRSYLKLSIGLLLLLTSLSVSAAAQRAFLKESTALQNPRANQPQSVSELEHHVFDLVNDERVRNGRSTLAWNDRAASAARLQSANMAESNFLGHRDLQGRRPSGRAGSYGIRHWRQLGENVAWLSGAGDRGKRVTESWMRSTGHRHNILDAKYDQSGIGLAIAADGKYYFTQVFVAN